MTAPVDVLALPDGPSILVSHAEIEAAVRAQWPSFDRMRPDHARKWKARISKALHAAAIARVQGGAP